MGCRWLETHVRIPGTVVLAVQSQGWMRVAFNTENAHVTTSKTDYLFMVDLPSVQALGENPTPEQIVEVLRCESHRRCCHCHYTCVLLHSILPHLLCTCINILIGQWPVLLPDYRRTSNYACLIVRAIGGTISEQEQQPRSSCTCRHCIGAYEAKTKKWLDLHGLLAVWPQAVCEALALNYMTDRRRASYFIPVFGGDFNRHLVVHAAPTDEDFALHAAYEDHPSTGQLSVRYMQHLLQQTKAAATIVSGKYLIMASSTMIVDAVIWVYALVHVLLYLVALANG